jgi:Fe/S biogenesis protein NfuA
VDEVICVSPGALDIVREALAKEKGGDGLALWLEVNGISGDAYTYDLWFGPAGAIAPGDAEVLVGGLRFVVPQQSIERVRGATLDASHRGIEGGLVISNPNLPPTASARAPRGALSGPVAERLLGVLERDVNPFLASHGGHVDLVGVEEPTAYVEMSGGCQGCGLARATLSQGIVVALTDAVEEISEVVDVTDHSSGSHPYFEPGVV